MNQCFSAILLIALAACSDDDAPSDDSGVAQMDANPTDAATGGMDADSIGGTDGGDPGADCAVTLSGALEASFDCSDPPTIIETVGVSATFALSVVSGTTTAVVSWSLPSGTATTGTFEDLADCSVSIIDTTDGISMWNDEVSCSLTITALSELANANGLISYRPNGSMTASLRGPGGDLDYTAQF